MSEQCRHSGSCFCLFFHGIGMSRPIGLPVSLARTPAANVGGLAIGVPTGEAGGSNPPGCAAFPARRPALRQRPRSNSGPGPVDVACSSPEAQTPSPNITAGRTGCFRLRANPAQNADEIEGGGKASVSAATLIDLDVVCSPSSDTYEPAQAMIDDVVVCADAGSISASDEGSPKANVSACNVSSPPSSNSVELQSPPLKCQVASPCGTSSTSAGETVCTSSSVSPEVSAESRRAALRAVPETAIGGKPNEMVATIAGQRRPALKARKRSGGDVIQQEACAEQAPPVQKVRKKEPAKGSTLDPCASHSRPSKDVGVEEVGKKQPCSLPIGASASKVRRKLVAEPVQAAAEDDAFEQPETAEWAPTEVNGELAPEVESNAQDEDVQPPNPHEAAFAMLRKPPDDIVQLAAAVKERQSKMRTFDDVKAWVTDQYLRFTAGDGAAEHGTIKKPSLPEDGAFFCIEEYTSIWCDAVVYEAQEQMRSEAGRASREVPFAVSHMPDNLLIHRDPGDQVNRFILDLVTGSWRGDGRTLTIVQNQDGGLRVSDGSGWSAILGPPGGVEGWRRAIHGNRSYELRLRDWNLLEVKGTKPLKRVADLRFGSLVLLSDGIQKGGMPAYTLGVVERIKQHAVVRCYSQTMPRQARLASSSLISCSREMQAIFGCGAVPVQLRGELLGTTPSLTYTPRPMGQEKPACLTHLNPSQLNAVEAACSREAGFTLVWGPPGTGKSSTLLSMINALHLREYELLHRAVEEIVLGDQSGDPNTKWSDAVRKAPRLLVAASSNAAVDALLVKVVENQFKDRKGNVYKPWGMIRVGTSDKGGEYDFDLDSRVKALMCIPDVHVCQRIAQVTKGLDEIQNKVKRLQSDLRRMQKAMPIPHGWEIRIGADGKMLEFHDHLNKKASWKPPPAPHPGQPTAHLLTMSHATTRLGELIHCADKWWELIGQDKRLRIVLGKNGMSERDVREKIEASFLGNAQVVFATLNSVARLRQSMAKNEPFGVIVVDEAAQATEPSTLIPLEFARSKRCILVGDDRQLPPTVFAQDLSCFARTLFERMRQRGHTAELLAMQYRMAPEISGFPRTYFYGGELLDGDGMLEKTRRKTHAEVPPVIFLNFRGSTRRSSDSSWANLDEAQVCDNVWASITEIAGRHGESQIAEDVVFLTPYRAQQDELRKLLKKRSGKTPPMVSTVDGFQGREAELVIFSAVRAPDVESGAKAGIGFLSDERRLNVAVTRAKSVLIIVGHADTLKQSPAWRAFISYIQRQPRRCWFHTIRSPSEAKNLFELWPKIASGQAQPQRHSPPSTAPPAHLFASASSCDGSGGGRLPIGARRSARVPQTVQTITDSSPSGSSPEISAVGSSITCAGVIGSKSIGLGRVGGPVSARALYSRGQGVK